MPTSLCDTAYWLSLEREGWPRAKTEDLIEAFIEGGNDCQNVIRDAILKRILKEAERLARVNIWSTTPYRVELIDDVLSDVMLDILEAGESQDDGNFMCENFPLYVKRIAINAIHRLKRHHFNTRRASLGKAGTSQLETDRLAIDEDLGFKDEDINPPDFTSFNVDPEQQKVVEDYLAGLTWEEIAKTQGCSASAVKERLKRAIQTSLKHEQGARESPRRNGRSEQQSERRSTMLAGAGEHGRARK